MVLREVTVVLIRRTLRRPLKGDDERPIAGASAST